MGLWSAEKMADTSRSVVMPMRIVSQPPFVSAISVPGTRSNDHGVASRISSERKRKGTL